MNARERFLDKLRDSLAAGTFIKLTLSESSDESVRNLYARVVELREGRRLQLVRRHQQRDETKNVAVSQAPEMVAAELDSRFARAYLFTTGGDWQWRGPGPGQLKSKRPTFSASPRLEHNRPKATSLAKAPWLIELGVTSPDGTARPGMGDKLKQIERFTEILGHLVEAGPLRAARRVRLVDLGAGKGYLTFAAHEYFRRRNIEVVSTGVERRPDLVERTNRIAGVLDLSELKFVAGEIATFAPEDSIDILVALHACNTATDDALFLGVQHGAQLLLTSPCCHQELRPQLAPPPVLAPVLDHGILLERYAEMLTDGIRALLLGIHGYDPRVFEFIALEHTGKNLMISGQRLESPPDPEPLRAQLRELFSFHDLREQRLARLLREF